MNTEAVIRHLSVHKNFSLIRKVKSIPHHFVEIVIRTLKIWDFVTGQPSQKAFHVSSLLWKGKTPEAVRTTMRESGFDHDSVAHGFSPGVASESKETSAGYLSVCTMPDSVYNNIGKKRFEKAWRITVVDAE